jgi:hypothetical protein
LHERGQLSPLAPAHQTFFAPRPGPTLTTPKPDKSDDKLTVIIDALLTTACIFVIANRLTD